MKQNVKFITKGLLVITVVIAVVFSATALRLLFSPVGVPYATEMVESETQRLLPGWEVSFESAEIGWGWSDVRPWLRIENATVKDPEGKIDAKVEHLWLAISRSDILAAKLTVRAIEIDGLHLEVKSGGGKSNFWKNIDLKNGPKSLAPIVKSLFKHSSQLSKGMMRVSDVSMTNIDANILDELGSKLMLVNIPTIDFEASHEQLKLLVNGYIQSGKGKIDLRVTANGDVKNEIVSFDWDSDPVNLKDFTSHLKVPAVLTYIDAPVALSLSLEADARTGLTFSDLYLEVGKGQLSHSVAYPIPAEVNYVAIEAEFDPKSGNFLVNDFKGEIKDYNLSGEALVYFDEGVARPGIKASLGLNGLTLPELKVYWPNIGRNTAKKWVMDNMTTGSFSNVNFMIDVGSNGVGAFRDGSVFDLTFKFRGLDAKYSKTLPIITEAEGYSRLTRKMFDLTVTSGQVDGMTLGTSTFAVHDIHKRGEAYSITDVHIAAPLEQLLHFTAFAPISLNERMNIAPERLKGYAITDTNLRIPMVKGVTGKDIEFTTRVQGTDVEVHDLLGGEGIRKGTVDLTVDKRGLKAEGDIDFNGVSMHAKWSEDFVKGTIDGEDTTKFILSGAIDEVDLLAFNVDISNFLDGKVPSEATFTGRKFNITQGHFTADGTPAIINVDQLAWQKISGRPVVISGSMTFSPDEITLSPLNAQGPDINMSADLLWKLGDDKRFEAQFNVGQLDKNIFTASVEQIGIGPYHATISANEIDVGPFFESHPQEAVSVPVIAPVEPLTAYIALSAKNAHFLNGVEATDLTLQSTFTDDGPQETKGKATFKSGKDINLSVFIEDNGTRSLWVETEDAGALLSGTGLFAHGVGGKVTFNGQIMGWGESLELSGLANGKNMKVIPLGMLEKEVEIGVITGIDEIVGDKGTDFGTLVVPFKYDKGLLDINNLRASGSSIGLTLEGQADYNSQKINMNGVYVPVYGLNAAISNIPIIGNILTGKKGEGIFGVAYRVKGMIDNPTVSINPLSGIAPGIFRRIFEGGKGKVSDVKDEKPKEEKPKPENESE